MSRPDIRIDRRSGADPPNAPDERRPPGLTSDKHKLIGRCAESQEPGPTRNDANALRRRDHCATHLLGVLQDSGRRLAQRSS